MSKLKLRKFKRYILENKTRIIVISIILFSFFFTIGFSLYNSVFYIGGVTKIEIDQEEFICDINISANFNQNSSWSNNTNGKNVYDYTLIIENKGSETITGWTVVIKGPSDLGINWVNANTFIRADGALIMTPYDWNSVIEPGSSLNFPMALETVEDSMTINQVLFNNCNILNNNQSVEPDTPVELIEIVLTPLQETIEIGDTLNMRAIKNPINAPGELSWQSSDPNIASVSNNGVVTAKSAGTVEIMVSSGNISTTSTIIVKEKTINPPITDTDLSITFSSPYYFVEGRQIQFKIVVQNNTNVSHTKFSFDMDIPANSRIDLWQNPGVTISGTTFLIELSYGNVLQSNGSIEVTGNITLPENYNVVDYLNPNFTNIRIIE